MRFLAGSISTAQIRKTLCLRTPSESSIDFSAMAGAENENKQPVVFNLADQAVIAHAVFPELPELRTVQGLSDAAWVVQRGAFVKNLQDGLALLRVELAQFAVDLGRQLNLPGHAASGHLRVEQSARSRCECV